MDLEGTIYTKVEVNTFRVIQKLCQEIGVVDELNGRVCVKIEDNAIVKYSIGYFEEPEREVLYNQPFDVQYALTLIRLYEQTRYFLSLKNEEVAKSEDYKTAYRLDIRSK